MKTTVSTFVTIDAVIRMSNINIDFKQRKGSMVLGIKEAGKRKFSEENVNFTITSELYDYLVLLRDNKVKVAADNERGYDFIKTGTKSTSFQKFLAKIDKEFKPGILQELVFETNNTSDDYCSCPFRLVKYAEGNAVLTLVNLVSKSKKDIIDPSTGEVKTFYSQKYGTLNDGTRVKAFVRPEKYRRFIQQTISEVEVVE